VIGDPPSCTGEVHLNDTEVGEELTRIGVPGWLGAPEQANTSEVGEKGDLPISFTADTWKTYFLSVERP
jgi:hypothetical protein